MSLYHFLKHGQLHHDLQNGRDREGRLTEQCTLCNFSRVVLGEDVKRDGPAHAFQADMGARTMKAQRVNRNNVTRFERESQR